MLSGAGRLVTAEVLFPELMQQRPHILRRSLIQRVTLGEMQLECPYHGLPSPRRAVKYQLRPDTDVYARFDQFRGLIDAAFRFQARKFERGQQFHELFDRVSAGPILGYRERRIVRTWCPLTKPLKVLGKFLKL